MLCSLFLLVLLVYLAFLFLNVTVMPVWSVWSVVSWSVLVCWSDSSVIFLSSMVVPGIGLVWSCSISCSSSLLFAFSELDCISVFA